MLFSTLLVVSPPKFLRLRHVKRNNMFYEVKTVNLSDIKIDDDVLSFWVEVV